MTDLTRKTAKENTIEEALAGIDTAEATLAADYTMTTSYANIGLSILLNPGVWFVNYSLTWNINSSSGGNIFGCARLHDGSTVVSDSHLFRRLDTHTTATENTHGINTTDTFSMILPVSVSATYNVQARVFTAYTTRTIYQNGSDLFGGDMLAVSKIHAVRLKGI